MTRARMAAAAAVLLVGLGLLPGCGGSEPAGGPGGSTLVDASRAAELAADTDVVVLDVRTPAEFAAGRIEGAVNLDVESGRFAAELERLDPDDTYLVYCRTGRRSATAVNVMSDAGFSTVYELDGGIVAWQEAGQPLFGG